MALWLQSNCDCEVIEGLISQNAPTATSERERKNTSAAATGGRKSKQAGKKKKKKEESFTQICKLTLSWSFRVRMHLLKPSLNFWLEFQYHPLLMCFCFFFFLFCKNLRGGFFNQKWLYNSFEVLFGNLAANVWNLRWKTGFWQIIVSDKLFFQCLRLPGCFHTEKGNVAAREAPTGLIDGISRNPLSVLLPLLFTSASSWSHVAPPHDATSPYGAFIIYHVYISYYLFIICSHQIT